MCLRARGCASLRKSSRCGWPPTHIIHAILPLPWQAERRHAFCTALCKQACDPSPKGQWLPLHLEPFASADPRCQDIWPVDQLPRTVHLHGKLQLGFGPAPSPPERRCTCHVVCPAPHTVGRAPLPSPALQVLDSYYPTTNFSAPQFILRDEYRTSRDSVSRHMQHSQMRKSSSPTRTPAHPGCIAAAPLPSLSLRPRAAV